MGEWHRRTCQKNRLIQREVQVGAFIIHLSKEGIMIP